MSETNLNIVPLLCKEGKGEVDHDLPPPSPPYKGGEPTHPTSPEKGRGPIGALRPYKGKAETSIINTLLVICLVLGFLCVATIYLPSKLRGAALGGNIQPKNSQLLAILPPQTNGEAATLPTAPTGGTFIRFTPEPDPPAPFELAKTERREEEQKNIDPPPLEPTKTVTKDEEQKNADPPPPSEPQMKEASNPVPTAPLSSPPTSSLTKIHKMSSLASYDPSKGTGKEPKGKPWYAVSPAIETDVAFWRDIYSKYDSHHVVLHDMKYLSIVYGIMDLTDIDADTSLTDIERQRARQAKVDAEKDVILSILDDLDKGTSSNEPSERAREIRELFRNIDEPDKFHQAKERGVRAQTGQRDKFIEGLKYSGRYLGEIESIFENMRLPKELTFLIFVESMFNPNAHSSVGASGVWQFMRATGKIYNLTINAVIDERNDPIRATYAAASLLQHDYDNLGSWPLAINAYNAGRGRLQQAVARLGTSDIATIVKRFEHPAYGFASRNFYMEYLAAMDVAKNYRRYFGNIEFDRPLRYDLVRVEHPIRLPEIATVSGMPITWLVELNQALSNSVFEGQIPLPAGFEIRVPEGKGGTFLIAAANSKPALPLWHTVEDGETIEDIASFYDVSVTDILRANKKLGKRLNAGQHIRISK
jgi:membrane-bound lytic murein transglycosylase D